MKKIFCRAIMVVTAMMLLMAGAAWGYSGGDGSADNPYQITNLCDLDDLSGNSGDWGAAFLQTDDIDASGTEIMDAGAGWSPIGDSATKFTGVYDGNGHTIQGIYINRGSDDYQGLFGYTNGASIKNLGLTEVDITGKEYVGGLVGKPVDTSLENSYSSGEVSGEIMVGGLAGIVDNGSTIADCHSAGIVAGLLGVLGNTYVGGLVGDMRNNSTISGSHSTAAVSGAEDLVGGLAGRIAFGCSITNSYSEGTVTGSASSVGGLVGQIFDDNSIINCYSTGDVSGDGNYVGGLVGWVHTDNSISNSYSESAVTGSGECVGGLVGSLWYDSYIENSRSSGTVTGGKYAGGLVGVATVRSEIINSYSTVDISTDEMYVGGLVGSIEGNSAIVDCYSRGFADGDDYVGGLAAFIEDSSIENSYSTGPVTGNGDEVGGFVGAGTEPFSVDNCFWDMDTSGLETSGDGDQGATGKSSTEMKDIDTFTDTSSDGLDDPWDFPGTWRIHEDVNDGYPQLLWAYDGPEPEEEDSGDDNGIGALVGGGGGGGGGGCFINTLN